MSLQKKKKKKLRIYIHIYIYLFIYLYIKQRLLKHKVVQNIKGPFGWGNEKVGG